MSHCTSHGSATTCSVVLADGNPIHLDVLSQVVRASPRLTLAGAVADGRHAVCAITRLRPDVAVLDAELPRVSGPMIHAVLTRLGLATRILLLSAHGTGRTVVDSLVTGGSGSVAKDTPLADIEAMIYGRASVDGTVLPGSGR